MKDNAERKGKKKIVLVIKVIVISVLVIAIATVSAFVAFNWDDVFLFFEHSTSNSFVEAIDESDDYQEETQTKTEKQKKKKSSRKKKKSSSKTEVVYTYVLNTNTGKFHYDYCRYVDTIAEHNLVYSTSTREEIIELGYTPCLVCNP